MVEARMEKERARDEVWSLPHASAPRGHRARSWLLQGSAKLSLLRTCPTVPCVQGNAARIMHNSFPSKQTGNNREVSALEAALLTFTRHLGRHFVTNQLLSEVSRAPSETRSPSSGSNLGNTPRSHLSRINKRLCWSCRVVNCLGRVRGCL